MGNVLRKRVTIVVMLAGAMLLAVFFGSNAIAKVADAGQPGKPLCMNGRDDDFDGKVDYPSDPGCSAKRDRSELDPASPLAPPPPPASPQPPPPPPPPPSAPTTSSWNPYVTRTPVLATVEHVIGSQAASCGGASEAGGGFPNHLKGTEGATPGQPLPSEIPANAAFVEIDGLRIESTGRKPWGSGDGDATTNATDPTRSDISSTYMKGIHLEVSRYWGTRSTPSGIAGPFLSPYPGQTVWPAPGTLVDVQGFVRWDALHVLSTSHYCSGWELHPVSAWRLHR
jgi:hypothetical protein